MYVQYIHLNNSKMIRTVVLKWWQLFICALSEILQTIMLLKKFQLLIIFFILPLASCGTRYCQPGQDCWPTPEEIQEFVSSLSQPTVKPECFGPYFSKDEPGDLIDNLWYPEAPEKITPYDLGNFRNKVEDIIYISY